MPFKGSKHKKAKKASASLSSTPKELNLTQASHLVDKNSRTMVKLCQLLEVQKKDDTNDKIDKDGILSRRIEKLKNRLNRRLIKLAKWVDKPEYERSDMGMKTRSNAQSAPTVDNRGRGRPPGPNYKGYYKDRVVPKEKKVQEATPSMSLTRSVMSANTPRLATSAPYGQEPTPMNLPLSVMAASYGSGILPRPPFPGQLPPLPRPQGTPLPSLPVVGSTHLSTLIDLQKKMAMSVSNALSGTPSAHQQSPAVSSTPLPPPPQP